jgi:phosphotransferase system  glucose/maltose/N-acetylglucosamine-specific IIC component
VLTWLAGVVLVAVVASTVIVKLLARRRAPDPGWFIDSTRAAGALTVIGTMFAVLLAFTIFYALQNYQRARDGGSMEAIAVTELHNVADVLEGHDGSRLHGDLICYSRAVVSDEWPAMARGESSASVQHWVDTMVTDFAAINPSSPKQEAAYGQWFDQQAERRDGRRARAVEAEPSVPPPLWIVLGIGAACIFTYMCVQADRRESAVVQAVPIAFVSALVTSALLVVAFLDHPYAEWAGNLQPAEMRVTLSLIDDGHVVPCDSHGGLT